MDVEGNASPFAMYRHHRPAVGRDVGLSQQGDFMVDHRVRQVVHDDLTRRSAGDRLFAFHDDQTICVSCRNQAIESTVTSLAVHTTQVIRM